MRSEVPPPSIDRTCDKCYKNVTKRFCGTGEAIVVSRTLLAIALSVGVLVYAAGAAAQESAAIEVRVSGNGVVQSDPSGAIACGTSCSTSLSVGSTLALRALPAEHNQFIGWSGACTGTSRICELVVEEAGVLRVEARFEPGFLPPLPPSRRLSVTRSGAGAVTSDPRGIIDCGTDCWTEFSGGASVRLRATPEAGSVFQGWAGDCSGTGPCETPLNEHRRVVATFRPSRIPPGFATLIVTNQALLDPEHVPIRITTPKAVTTCVKSCLVPVENGWTVDLAGDVLRTWSGACAGEGLRCALAINGDAAVAGKPVQFIIAGTANGVNVARSGSGRVTSKPPGIDCGSTCAAAYKPDIAVELTATPAAGSRFVRWRGDCSTIVATVCSLKADAVKSATATFQRIQDELRLARVGDGDGSVVSEPAGIACGQTCRRVYFRGTQLRLRATAASGSRFTGWTGPCTGTGECALTIRGPTLVTARFERMCAARAFTNFAAQAKLKPRRLAVRLTLDSSASVRLRLLRRGAVLAKKTYPATARGDRVLPLRVPRSIRKGPARIEVRVRDVCSGAKTLSRPVVVR
jgi:hypothetical protein